MDYALLRREGIALLERLGGQVWTDYNAHDPGITILEQLCYAITDLGYRINYDLKDLLAGGEIDPCRSLFSPAQVLTSNPVTLLDLRKLVIDVAGVKNAWIETVAVTDPLLVYDPSELALYLETDAAQPPHRQPLSLGGLYRILIEPDEDLDVHPADILPEVNRRLHACRNLGEDFLPPVILPGQSIIVQAQIEIGVVEDPELLLAQIYQTLSRAISPRIRFYTLGEMLDSGRNIDDILDGPVLEHGFIDNTELGQFQRKVGLRASDLLQDIMDVAGVVNIGSILLQSGSQSEDWYLKLNAGSTPFLDMDTALFGSAGQAIILTRGGIQMQLDPLRVKQNIRQLQSSASEPVLSAAQRDIRLPAGKDRQVSNYFSFQHQFPPLYGIGSTGLPDASSPQRIAQSRQLKAYLMFFDQLLANYFAQLGSARELFSFFQTGSRTYFSQPLQDAGLALDDIRNSDSATHAARVQDLTEDPASGTSPAGRKNRFLNHLLARFAEQFTDYSLLQYAHLGEQDLIADKCAFLQDYPAIGMTRGSGFNYTQPAWDSENISGLEKRISRKLGISSYRKHNLAPLDANAEGGFHALEHILLRPSPLDKTQAAQTGAISWQTAYMAQPDNKDPYTHQLSFIFPDWIERFKRPDFRGLIEKTLREETPAHLHIVINWLTQAEMAAFEAAQKSWLETSISARLWDPINSAPGDEAALLTQLKLRNARDQMVQLLGIGMPYPLRDLKLRYDAIVAYNHAAPITILGAQVGVRYLLCDEDGNAILNNGHTFEVQLAAGQGDTPVVLNTPVIQKDITFTVLAIRETQDHQIHLEAYLNQGVEIKAGIDVTLPVVFTAAAGQIANGAQITTNYADKVTVTVSRSQEGISYKLVANGVDLSGPVKGNKGDIALLSNGGFMEDASINVLAFRTSATSIAAQLDTSLAIMVRPNPALAITIDNTILNYQGAAMLSIVAPQASVEYRLFKRNVALTEYLPDSTAGAMLVQTTEGRTIAVKKPAVVTDWSAPAGFVPVDLFKTASGKLSVSSGALQEDTLLIVQATKIVNREALQLTQALAVLLRPDPAPAVSVAQATVASGSPGMVQLTGTQMGVSYQLRLDAGNKPVNPPGYHVTNRGIETERVEVDMMVGDQGQPMLLLPAGSITQATSFNILANKTITGVTMQLTGKAAIGITAP